MNKYRTTDALSRSVHHIHIQNPWISAWWSAAFTGLGHLMTGKYGTALLLIAWEFVLNQSSGLNSAIYYSMTGQFQAAKQSIDLVWFLSYIPIYMFAIWDIFNQTVDMNRKLMLANSTHAEMIPSSPCMERHTWKKKNPVVAICWSLLFPGLGQLYAARIPNAFVLIFIFLLVLYYSETLPAVHLSLTGHFDEAIRTLNVQWYLYLPSLYGFSMYDAYIKTLASNRLFAIEQLHAWKKYDQNARFSMPLK